MPQWEGTHIKITFLLFSVNFYHQFWISIKIALVMVDMEFVTLAILGLVIGSVELNSLRAIYTNIDCRYFAR